MSDKNKMHDLFRGAGLAEDQFQISEDLLETASGFMAKLLYENAALAPNYIAFAIEFSEGRYAMSIHKVGMLTPAERVEQLEYKICELEERLGKTMKNKNPEPCGIVVVVQERPMALQVKDSEDNTHWIPKSQMSDESEISEDSKIGDSGELFLPKWLAVDKGLV